MNFIEFISFKTLLADGAMGTILHSRGIEIDSFSVPGVTLSDHRPLVCDFRVTHVARAAA